MIVLMIAEYQKAVGTFIEDDLFPEKNEVGMKVRDGDSGIG